MQSTRPKSAVALAVVLLLICQAQGGDRHSVYAPPIVWGKPEMLRANLGAASYTVKLNQVGNVPTQIVGRVRYINENGEEVTKEFLGRISFRTGNFVGQPVIWLKGIPTGTHVIVEVN
jgi:hypothetical protein